MRLAIQSDFRPVVGHRPPWLAGRGLFHLRRPAPQVSGERMAVTERTDWSLLVSAIAARQDRAAFAELFSYFAPRVKAFLLRSGVSEGAAEELAQETLLAVWRKAALFDPASNGAAAWIFTIARNLRIDARRREMRGGLQSAPSAEIEFQIDETALPDERLSVAQDELRVRAALKKLPDEQVRVIELSFFEDRAHAEISKVLNIPLGTVKSRLRLATNRLRNLLSDTHDH